MKGIDDDGVAVGQLKKPQDESAPPSRGRQASKPAEEGQADVGKALRNAFQATVDEQIPDELLDLLRRLD